MLLATIEVFRKMNRNMLGVARCLEIRIVAEPWSSGCPEPYRPKSGLGFWVQWDEGFEFRGFRV